MFELHLFIIKYLDPKHLDVLSEAEENHDGLHKEVSCQ